MSESKNSESKRGEGKDSSSNDAKGGGGSNEELMELVQEFCMSQKLEQTFEKFAIDHSDVFMKALDIGENDDEHPLAFQTIYLAYLAKFEGIIEEFIFKNGFKVEQFYEMCKDVLEDDNLFGSQRFFVEAILATSEYKNFYTLMRAEMQSIAGAANGPANSSSSSNNHK